MKKPPLLRLLSRIVLPVAVGAGVFGTTGCDSRRLASSPAEAKEDLETRMQSLVAWRDPEDERRWKDLFGRQRELDKQKPPAGDAEALQAWQSKRDAVQKRLDEMTKEAVGYRKHLIDLWRAWEAAEWKGYVIPDNYADSAGAGLPDPPPRRAAVK